MPPAVYVCIHSGVCIIMYSERPLTKSVQWAGLESYSLVVVSQTTLFTFSGMNSATARYQVVVLAQKMCPCMAAEPFP